MGNPLVSIDKLYEQVVNEYEEKIKDVPDAVTAEFEKVKGRDYYISWKRPEVPYSIKEYMHGRNGWKKVMKWQTARRNRRIKITEDDAAWREKSFYKKVEDIWNYD